MWNLEWLIFKLITHSEFQKMYRSTPKLLIKKWKIEKFTFVRRKSGRPPTPFGLRDGELTVLNEKVALYQRKNNVRPLISPEIEHLRGVFAIYKPPHTGNYFKYCILSHVSVISVLELTFSIRLRLWELRCLLMGILWALCFFTVKILRSQATPMTDLIVLLSKCIENWSHRSFISVVTFFPFSTRVIF